MPEDGHGLVSIESTAHDSSASGAAGRSNAGIHVSVCVCTYRRPQPLRRLLAALAAQKTGGRFTYSVVIADNDHAESARAVVAEYAAAAPIRVSYDVERRHNIALARNKAVEHASGEYLAFIDDDEEPLPDWLDQLVEAMALYRADGVLGPVIPRFAEPPPQWIVRGGLFERPSPPTGTWLQWRQTRTSNVLLRRRIFDDPANRFRPEYRRRGEDTNFFRRMIDHGMRFVWCAEACVYEIVPADRCRRRYLLKRALLRGMSPNNRGWPAVVALFAIPAYGVALPFLFVRGGQPLLMRYLIKVCDHLGHLLALIPPRLFGYP